MKQIQFQLQGPWVVLQPDVAEKLNLTEEQVEQLRELRSGQNQRGREVRKSSQEQFNAVVKQVNPDFTGFGRGNRGGGNGGGQGGQGGGNNGGGNNGGGNNGGGRQGRQQMTPAERLKMQEDMRILFENPDVQKAREKQQAATKAVEDESYALIMKALYPRQRATLKAMAGLPFDRSVMGGPFAGRFGGPPGGATAKNAAAKKKSSSDDDEDAPAATTTARPAGSAQSGLDPAAEDPARASPKGRMMNEKWLVVG